MRRCGKICRDEVGDIAIWHDAHLVIIHGGALLETGWWRRHKPELRGNRLIVPLLHIGVSDEPNYFSEEASS
jgi:hypothetical protein